MFELKAARIGSALILISASAVTYPITKPILETMVRVGSNLLRQYGLM